MRKRSKSETQFIDPVLDAIAGEDWDTLWKHALVDFEGERYSDALLRLCEAVERARDYADDDERKADAIFMLGFTLFLDYQMGEVEKLLVEALTLRIRNLGPTHPLVALTLQRLGDYYNAMGDWEQAEKSLSGAIVLLDLLGEKYPDDLHRAQILRSLALPLRRSGQYIEAREYLMRGLELLAERKDELSSRLAVLLHKELANLSLTFSDYLSADDHMTRALARQEQTDGPEHPLVGSACQVLGDFCARRGEFERAEGLLERSLAILKRDTSRPLPADLLESLATIKACVGKLEEALTFWQHLAELRREQGLLVESAAALEDVAWAHFHRRSYAESLACVRGGLQFLEEMPASDWRSRSVRFGLLRIPAFVALEERDFTLALIRFQEAGQWVAPREGEEVTPEHARALCDYAVVQLELKDPGQARQLCLDSLLVQASCIPPDDHTRARALRTLASAQKMSEQFAEAAETARELLLVLQSTGGSNEEQMHCCAAGAYLAILAGQREQSIHFSDQMVDHASRLTTVEVQHRSLVYSVADEYSEAGHPDLATSLNARLQTIFPTNRSEESGE